MLQMFILSDARPWSTIVVYSGHQMPHRNNNSEALQTMDQLVAA